MPQPEITALPPTPSLADPENFPGVASTFLGSLAGFRTDLNAFGTWLTDGSFAAENLGASATGLAVLTAADPAAARTTLDAMRRASVDVTDLDDATENAPFRFVSGASNAPFAATGMGITIAAATVANLMQIAVRASNGDMWVRSRSGSSWTAWGKVTRDADVPALAQAVGVGQTWQNVLASRSIGTSYRNETGKPIAVAVQCSGGSTAYTIQVSTDNSTWIDVSRSIQDGSEQRLTGFAIVPDDHYYRIAAGSNAPNTWAELR
jgi:hypothetical protein